MEGEEDGQEGTTERESERGRDQRDGLWPQMCVDWDPSSALWRHLLWAKQLGHVGERQDKELDAKRESREEEEQEEEEEREGEEVWLSVRAVTRRGKRRFG